MPYFGIFQSYLYVKVASSPRVMVLYSYYIYSGLHRWPVMMPKQGRAKNRRVELVAQ